ncbi:DUF2795 domain-containing protein [Amycolatopsis taiwanensis]|uniref:DUF2795 domain-containing protein n=1 Tax=Amycolatopsis taiwanensis TaxID=342230 RepID=A0A9W6RCG9_9PSEU|nr:DUF2795 domain-containing protein [Amycolatopsis taiwanensis]GLY71395.1 hypothetical protein Atai01_80140 [Amycolatopsis taiwanensis]
MDERLWTLLSDVDFPCSRAELLRHAAAGGADDDVLGHLAALPERRYPGLADVIREVPRAPGEK